MRSRPRALLAACFGVLCSATSSARADVAVIYVPSTAVARGIPLQAGDVLREGDDPTTLDVFRLLALESVNATRGTVRLRRIRAGAIEDVDLPAGDWALIAAPLDAAGNAAHDLDTALSQAQANADGARAAALLLARARLAAGKSEFAVAAEDFAAATASLPAQEDWIAHTQALAYERHPDRTQALHAAARAVELRRSNNAHPSLLAASLRLLAFWRAQTRDNQGAKQAADEAVRLAPDTLVAAHAHLVLSSVAMRSSRLDIAAEELDRAERFVARIAPAGLDAATLLSRRAVLSAQRREGKVATQAFNRALVELRRLAPDSMLLGRIAFNAQLHALERRRYVEAESLAREAMTTFAAVAPDSLEYAQARAALAEVLMRRTEYAQAEALLRAAAQASDVVDARSYEALSLKVQLGESLARQTRYGEALLLYDTIERVLGAPDAPSALGQTSLLADSALYRADVLSRLERCPEAIASAERALALYALQLRVGTERWEAHLTLSECRRRVGELQAAVDHALQASAGLYAIAGDGIQFAQAQFALARALRDSGSTAAAIKAYRAAIDGLERHREHVGASDEIRAQWAAQFQDFYKELMWLLATEGLNAAVLEIEARYRVQSLLQLLDADHTDLAAAWTAQGSNTTLANALPRDTALVSFVVGGDGTLAIVVQPGAPQATIFALPATRDLLVNEVDRMSLLGARASADPAAIDALQRIGQTLHAALIAPLLGAIDAYPRWVVVADGPLLRLPWAALVVQGGQQPRYLVEDRVLGIAPSAPVWAVLAQRPRAPNSILAFGDPSVDAGHDGTPRSAPLSALPGARREVATLAATYPGRVISYVGAAATEAQVRTAAAHAGSIHFALHSVIDASTPMASYIALAVGDRQNTNDNGRLSADEIARELHMNADVVVLSSCASARGAEAGGEGLFGLIRALHLAGTRAVIGTTWPVADQSTARLMGEFYQHRSAGLDSNAALAAAQRDWLAIARQRSWLDAIKRSFGVGDALPESAEHPFFWAGFVHSGAAAP